MHPRIDDGRAPPLRKSSQLNVRVRGISAANLSSMTNTKASFASIDTDLLADVQGGCGRRRRCRGGCGTKTVNIVNNYGAAPAPAAPAPAPAAPSGWSVNVNAGYAQA
jgi:hypothetical protein